MDREHCTPSRSPAKRQRDDVDSDSESDLDLEMQPTPESGLQATDMSPIDKKEKESLESFVTSTCGCSLGPNKQPCSKQFSKQQIETTVWK